MFKKIIKYSIIFLFIVIIEFIISRILSTIGWKIIQSDDKFNIIGIPAFCLMGGIITLIKLAILILLVRLYTKERIVLIFSILIVVLHYLISSYGIIYCCCIYDSLG